MSNFQTKVDFSTQVKEYPNTDGTLSGSVNVQQYTILGTDYSDLPMGLDPSSTGISATYVYTTMGYFTGTTGSTTYYFTDSNMDIANPYLNTLNGTNSGLTQNVIAFSSIYSTTVDGNFFDVLFSGVSFDMTPVTFEEYTSGEFSGVTFTNVLNYLSGTTYPWWFLKSGSTTWGEVKGRLQTDRVTIIEGAFPGYVLTSDNLNGDATWQPVSGLSWAVTACTSPLFVSNIVSCPSSADTLTIYADTLALDGSFQFLIPFSGGNGTDSVLVVDSNGYVKTIPQFSGGSGTCITDLYVTNIHGCSPIHIQPTSSDDVYLVEGGGNVGIGVTSATTKLQVSGTTIINSNYIMLSDTLTSIPSLPNFNGLIVTQDTDKSSGYYSQNTNVSGSSSIFLFNDSSVGVSLGVGGSQLIRSGIPLDGVNFYQNKVVLRGNSLSDGMVFNPNSGNPSGTFWWELAGASTMILKGDGFDGAYLGLALNPDGTEMPTSNLQIGGTGSTGTFKYIDGNQQNGYVLTSDASGNATWQAPTGGGSFTGGTGSCITDLYVSNIHSCSPLNINPLDEGNVYFGSTSAVTIDLTNNRVGINTITPEYTFDFNTSNGNTRFHYNDTNPSAQNVLFSGNSSVLNSIGASSRLSSLPLTIGMVMGLVGENSTLYPGYGNPLDAFLYAGADSNVLNIVSAPTSSVGTNTDDIRFYAGQFVNSGFGSDMHIQGIGATRGYIGMGTESPQAKLHVSGNTIINSDYMMLSNTLTSIPPINFKGFIVAEDYTGDTGVFIYNPNLSGETGLFVSNDSSALLQLFVGGSQNVRKNSPTTGDYFYQNKVVLKGNDNISGMVFNPTAGDPSSTFWWEIDGASTMVLKGDGVNSAYLGLSLNPDGTEMPTSNLQIGGTGTTGTVQVNQDVLNANSYNTYGKIRPNYYTIIDSGTTASGPGVYDIPLLSGWVVEQVQIFTKVPDSVLTVGSLVNLTTSAGVWLGISRPFGFNANEIVNMIGIYGGTYINPNYFPNGDTLNINFIDPMGSATDVTDGTYKVLITYWNGNEIL